MRRTGAVLVAALLGLWAAPPAVPQSSPPQGSPPSPYGVTLSVAELMDRQRNSPQPKAPRRPRLHTRPGPSTPLVKKALLPAPAGASSSSPRFPQTVGTTFSGDSSDVSIVTPPDCIGAVGPDQFLVTTNHAIAVYSKAGVLGALNIDPTVFFSAVISTGASAGDPRVRFDRLTQRWFISMIDDGVKESFMSNRVLIAVSSGPHITGSSSFTFFSFQHDLVSPAGDVGALADYDTLGIDANALYIGTNVFFGGPTGFDTTVFVIQKSSILAAGPMNVTAFRDLTAGGGAGIFTPQGVDNDDPAATEGYFVGTDSAETSFSPAVATHLIVKRISNPGSKTPTISGDFVVPIPSVQFFQNGVVTSGNFLVDDLDLRLFMGVVKNVGGVPALWTAHNIQTNSGATDAVAWYKIGNLTTTPGLLDTGIVSGTSSTESCWLPSLAVTGQGHMVMGYNFASPTERIGARSTSHLATDGPGVTQAATLLQQSTVDYYGENPPPPKNPPKVSRWGDYSYTSVDPNDNMTVWTIQELAQTNSAWQVQVFQLKAPPPPSPTSAVPSSIQAGLGSVSVTVTGTAGPGQGFYEPGSAFPQHLTVLLKNPVSSQTIPVNQITVVDATHLTLDLNTVGLAAGGFTLTVTNPDGQAQTSTAGFVTISGASATPSCVITAGTSPTNANPVFNVTFSSAVAGLAAGNFVLTNAASAILTGSGASYVLTVTPSGTGPETVTCRLPANVVSSNTVSNTASIVFDKSPLTATITPTAVATDLTPILYSVVFNKPVTGLGPGSFSTTSGTISSVTGSGAYYTVAVSGSPTQGSVTLTLHASAVTDAAGNANPLTSASEVYDITAPVVTIAPPGPDTNLSPIPFTITVSDSYDQLIQPLTLADLTVINGTAVSLTGSGPYTLLVTPSGQGTVTVQIAAGLLQDQAGNLNVVVSSSTIYDTVPPNTSLITVPPNPSGVSSATFVFASTKPGTQYRVQLDGGAVTLISTNTITYTGLSQGDHTFSVAAVDLAGNIDPTPATYGWSIPLIVTDGAAPLLYPFDSQAFLVNFTVSAPTSGVGWAVDATPATILGAPPYFTAPASLNYNNGVNYITGASANSGTARTPAIDRTVIPSTGWVKFMCNYQTDNGATTDLRTVNIYQGSTTTVLLSQQLSGATCSAMGTWHEHAIPLQNAWTPSVSVEFSFNTVDALNNSGAGWFVDDLEISDLVVSGLHQYPAGGASPIPVGGSTTSGAVDFRGVVSMVATSAHLEVEVQPVGTAFTGTPNGTSPTLPPGQTINARVTLPALGAYHWRARTVDSVTGTSAWMEFGVNPTSDPDFTVVPVPVASGGGGGGGGCGTTGLEGILIAGLLRWFRRPKGTRG